MASLRVVVVGGGIAGLAAADRIASARPEVDVLLLEAAASVGGKLARIELAGSPIDVGAEAMLARRPEGLAAAEIAGLTGELIHPLTTAALLRNRGVNRPLPARTMMGVPTDPVAVRTAGVLSEPTLDRIAAEPLAGPYPPLTGDISVGDLVAARFGDEVVQRLVDPLLGGVYAGHAHSISLLAAVPSLGRRLLAGGGSLLEAAAADLPVPTGAPAAPVFATVAGGLARLPERLAERGRFTVRTSAAVRAIRPATSGFTIDLGPVPAGEQLHADAIVLATPPAKSSALLRVLAPVAAAELAGIDTASMAIVTLAFDRLEPGTLPAGSGLLIPGIEGLDSKAMTFSSQKWPGVGEPSGVSFLRASLGRAGEELVLQREDAELVAVVRAELAELTGLRAAPLDSHVQRWGGALPQYAVGHLDRVARIRAAVAEVAGLAVCGASYDGVGIPACIGSAHKAADRVLAGLARAAE